MIRLKPPVVTKQLCISEDLKQLLKILLVKMFSKDSDFFFTVQNMKFWTKSLYMVEKILYPEKKNVTKGRLSYHLFVKCFSQLSFVSEVYTKLAAVADFVYTSESNESCEKHSTQR